MGVSKLKKAIIEINKKKRSEINRKAMLKSKYKLTIEEYDSLLVKQQFCCAVCKKSFDLGAKRNHPVDHCHKIEKIRGIVHFNCNILLGYGRDDIELLNSAIEYLKQ